MGYFSNGSEGEMYQDRYCLRCANYRDKDDGRGHGCAIWDLHLLYVGEKEWEAALNEFIPREGIFNGECTMFLESHEKQERPPNDPCIACGGSGVQYEPREFCPRCAGKGDEPRIP